MATLITGCAEPFSTNNSNPVSALPFGELTEYFHIDPTMSFPIRPPAWVMAQAALTAAVTAGTVTVE